MIKDTEHERARAGTCPFPALAKSQVWGQVPSHQRDVVLLSWSRFEFWKLFSYLEYVR